MEKLILGIDIGGTSIKIGLINVQGVIKHHWEIPTNTKDAGAHIVKEIWASVLEQMEKKSLTTDRLLGIGIGAPGFTNVDEGIVYEAVNIGWKNLNLAEAFKEWTDLPVYVANDANVAALGENWVGAGEQSNHMIALTLGTGVGSGIISNGQLINGANGTGGEIGHMTIDPNGYPCNCGLKGCLETIASATGIVRQALERAKKSPSSSMARIYEKNGELSTKEIFDLAKEGKKDALQLIEEVTDVLGFAIANLAVLLNPEKVLIGGGVSKAGEFLIERIDQSFKKYALPRIYEVCEIKVAKLGNDAGMIGAAYLVKERHHESSF